jgi:putative transposase
MARLSRICLPGIPQHVIQRGNNRQICFVSDDDMAAYAHWLYAYSLKYEVAVHAWVFMTNHVHLLATPRTSMGVSAMMQSLGRRYVRYFNDTYDRTGTLWEGRYRSSPVEADTYLLVCQRYIELNPVRAGMVDDPGSYRWSSYQCNGLGTNARLLTPHPVYLALGGTADERCAGYRSLFVGHLEETAVAEIRNAVNKGMALGKPGFLELVEHLSGRRARPGRPGRKPGRGGSGQLLL